MLNLSRPKIDLTKLRPTSKLSLKLTCLSACGNDIGAARELYGFIAEGMELPDTDPAEPSSLERIMAGADGFLGWIQGHGDEILKGYQIIRAMRGGGDTARVVSSAMPSAQPIPDV